MKIVACYKNVPEEEEIMVTQEKTLDFSKAQWKVGQYDLNAVEAGMKLKEEYGGHVVVLTATGETAETSKLRKSILSKGPEEMFAIKDKAIEKADSFATANILKAGVEKIGDVDLVLCGEGSGDLYAQQVGPVLGALLGWPTVNAVNKISTEGNKLIVERNLENGIEVLEIELPAVICVSSDINIPRMAAMKEILGAGKKPFSIWGLEDVGVNAEPSVETVSILAPEQADRLRVIIDGDSAECIETLYNYLRKAL